MDTVLKRISITMNSLILVSHSHLITDGLKEMVSEMASDKEKLTIYSCGGTDDNRIGTDPTKILTAIEDSANADYIYLIGDIGSGLMSIDMALELVDDLELKDKCHVINGPLVEGAFVIGVQTMIDPKPEAVNAQIDSVIESFKE